MIHPSIDILGGRVVQLRGGDPDDCRVALDDVVGVAAQFHRHGELAVIDLDAALGRGDNLELIEALCARFDCRVGGGIRDHERADRLLRAGARKIIIGTRAEPDFLRRYPRERVIVALDARGGRVVDHGWTQSTGAPVLARAAALEAYCSEFLYTLVDSEGSLGGIDLAAVGELVAATDNRVVAAGGIASLDEVMALERMGASSQLGMAIYLGVLSLTDAFMAQCAWQRHDGAHAGLLPVVVQDEADQVVMCAWVDREALAMTLSTGDAWYFSRSRGQHWRKGESSGHTQRVDAVRYDCDGDTLLYRVRQRGEACHVPGRYSCFGDQRFSLARLEATLYERRAAAAATARIDAEAVPVAADQAAADQAAADQAAADQAAADQAVADQVASVPGPSLSYSARLMTEPGLCEAKLIEEAAELNAARARRDIVWEAADVLYFTLARLVREDIPLASVLRELEGRAGRRRAADGAMVRAEGGR